MVNVIGVVVDDDDDDDGDVNVIQSFEVGGVMHNE